jgi:hypothetical protein
MARHKRWDNFAIRVMARVSNEVYLGA